MKILWAVDIYENHPKALEASQRFLTALSETVNIKVDAVSVVSIDYAIGSKGASREKEKNKDLLTTRLDKISKEKWFGKKIILLESQLAQRVAVLNLTEYAKKNKYDAIMVIKHSGKSRRPHYLGSFAEMTAFLSSIPIFLINPDGIIPKHINKVIVAVDESLEKGKEFKKLVSFFPFIDLSIKLFHRIRLPLSYRLGSSANEYFFERNKLISQKLSKLKKIGEESGAGVDLDIALDKRGVDDSILRESRKGHFDLIVTIHKGKEVTGFLLGRITRRILQNADRPVLLFRP